MPSTYDPLLRLELQATGENENTWGDKTNSNIELLGQAIAGHVSVAITGSGDYSLSTSSGATDEARRAFITLSGTVTGTRNIIVPSNSKTYYFRRNTSGSFDINIKTASGAAATLPTSGVGTVVCDGLDCWLVVDGTKFATTGGQITGATNVSVSTSVSGPAAFTITQTGAGPALVVEDAAGDTSPFLIDATGNVLVGTSVGYTATQASQSAVQVHRAAGTGAIALGAWTASVNSPQIQLLKSRGAAVGTRAAAEIGDALGRILFAGDTGTTFEGGAALVATVAASVSASVVPGQLLLQTAGAAGTLTTRVVVDQNGNMGVGTTSPAEALHLVGNFRIGSAVATQPTGTMPLSMARAWCHYDTTTGLQGSSNIASVTRNAAGDYSFTFTTAMTSAGYAPFVVPDNGISSFGLFTRHETTPTTSGFRVQFVGTNGVSFYDQDPTKIFVVVFG